MFMGLKATLFFTLISRLYYLQIIKEKEFKSSSDSNRIRLSLIPPLRGKIIDKNGKDLALNKDYYRIMFDPSVDANIKQSLANLQKILNLSDNDYQIMLKKIKAYSSHRPLILYERLTWEQLSTIEVNIAELPGLSVDVGQMRYFPMIDHTPHVIGYVGAASEEEVKENPLLNHPDFKVGLGGIEQTFEEDLRGTVGIKKVEVNAFGVPVREISRQEPIAGNNVKLTINKDLQEYISERLDGDSASSTVINIKTGEILAISSIPAFDPNLFTYGISHKGWKELIVDENRPLINKALTNQYPPGSTFKLVVAIAGLSQGIDHSQTVFCPGYVVLGGRSFHCWKKEGHGHMNMEDAIKNSCNCYFFTIAKKIGIDVIYDTAHNFGLGQTCDIGITNQQAGRIPSKEWKQKRFGVSWQMGDTLNAGIGQGFVLTTPFQLAIMVSRIASGKKIIPYLSYNALDGGTPEFKDLKFKPEHLNIVREGMHRVINAQGGTAYASRLKTVDFTMAGKTGSSQVVSRRIDAKEFAKMSEKDLKKLQNHASFVGFAPFENPKYAISVVIEHGGAGSQAAAPVAKDIMTKVIELEEQAQNINKAVINEETKG